MASFLRYAATLALLAATPLAAAAQATRPTAKPAAKPAVKTAPKPSTTTTAAKPAATTTAKPAPTPTPAARPAPAPAAAPTRRRMTAREGTFGVGANVVNAGVGFGTYYGLAAGILGGSSSVSPALSLSYERGIVEAGPGYIGVGGIVSYLRVGYSDGLFGGGFHDNNVLVAARGAFHYEVTPQFDTYAGVSLGMRHVSTSYDDGTSGSATDFESGVFAGARYFFTSNIGAFGEVGYDQSIIKVGLTAKF